MKNYKVALIHLLLSITVIAFFSLIVWFIWYPEPLLLMQGGFKIMAAFLGVTITLGPLLTLILFKPGKKGLWIDLITIAVLQVGAFLYSINIIYQERPQYIVFNTDRFTIVPASSIDLSTSGEQALASSLFDQPKLIYSELPDDLKAREKIMWDSLSGGKDLHQLPEYYQRFDDNIKKLQFNPHQLSYDKIIKAYPALQKTIQLFTRKQNITHEKALLFYPIEGKQHNGILMLAKQANIQWKVILQNPWLVQP